MYLHAMLIGARAKNSSSPSEAVPSLQDVCQDESVQVTDVWSCILSELF